MLIQNTNEKMQHAGYTAPLTCTCTRARAFTSHLNKCSM